MNEDRLLKEIRKKKIRNIVMALVAAAIIAAVLITLLSKPSAEPEPDAEVTVEIRCDDLSENRGQLNDKALEKYVPEDGTILAPAVCPIVSGQTTVFDVLDRVCREENVQMEYASTPAYGGVYVEGIGYLYELSAGKYSGWMFTVDGQSPGYAADKVKLEGGEEILWYYVVDYRGGR